MNEPGIQSVMDQATLAERVETGRTPDWVTRHWRTFRDALTGTHEGESCPCCFGAESVANGEPLYTAVPSMSDRDALLGLRDALLEYLDTYEDRDGRASFVVFFRPEADVETEARRELGRVTDTLTNTATAFGPLVAGVTVALAARVAAEGSVQLGSGLPVASLGLAVGGYVLVSAVVLVGLSTALIRGLDPVLLSHRIGLALPTATATYLASVVGAGLVVGA